MSDFGFVILDLGLTSAAGESGVSGSLAAPAECLPANPKSKIQNPKSPEAA